MGESLYAILGVKEDACRETIKDAYRHRAKNQHPDVSDADDATRTFKRLTIARDTLLDEDERARYDRLGHETYVSQHARADVFDVSSADSKTTGPQSDSVSAAKTVADGYGGDDWWRQRAGPEPKPAGATASAHTQSRSGSAASWAQSGSSHRTETESADPVWLSFVRAAGIWLFLHVLLICSAVATAVFVYTSVGPALVPPALVFGFVLVVASVAASTFHLVSIVYT